MSLGDARILSSEGATTLNAELRANGLEVEGNGRELRVVLANDQVYDVVRDVAAALSVPLSRMEVSRHKLEELFRDTVPEVLHG